jgi:hypothetical protein
MYEKQQKILEEGYNRTETQQQRLITVLGELEEEVEKQNSWQRVFVRGALYGLGTVIGATVLLALVASIFALTAKSLGITNIPFLGTFIEDIVVEQLQKEQQ